MIRFTPCECTEPGWCSRHQCVKPDPMFQLCQLNKLLFDAWEAGKGPCLPVPPDSTEDGSVDQPPGSPGWIQRAINFGAALARHTANGMHCLDDSRYERRLAVCKQCPSCDLERMICLERSCGCFLLTKARWQSERCPLSKWPIESEISTADNSGSS